MKPERESLLRAVLNRDAARVRALMEQGANPYEGVYPHRDATSPLAIAIDRGYGEIAAILQEGGRRTERHRHPELHVAARALDLGRIESLLAGGADPSAAAPDGTTPLDWAAHSLEAGRREEFAAVADALLARGAPKTARWAVASGDGEWIRGQHREGRLDNRIDDTGGLLRIAVTVNRPDILALLLELGLDPDERTRCGFSEDEDPVYTQGMPLYFCAGAGRYEMAELLLQRGADPNAAVYASGDPVFQAFSQRDWKMVDLLRHYGGVACATTAGLYRQTEMGRRMLAGREPCRLERGGTVAEELLWGAACGGDPELVRLALEHVDWPRDDPRWFEMLEQPLRIWDHGGQNRDRSTYPICFGLILRRCDPNLRGRMEQHGFGLTILHSVAGSREHVTAQERLAFATMLLDAGARLDMRDHLLLSTPLGWACRWGRAELAELFLKRGADPVESDAEDWATPRAWALRRNQAAVLAVLDNWG